jgi:hypothetical protein
MTAAPGSRCRNLNDRKMMNYALALFGSIPRRTRAAAPGLLVPLSIAPLALAGNLPRIELADRAAALTHRAAHPSPSDLKSMRPYPPVPTFMLRDHRGAGFSPLERPPGTVRWDLFGASGRPTALRPIAGLFLAAAALLFGSGCGPPQSDQGLINFDELSEFDRSNRLPLEALL